MTAGNSTEANEGQMRGKTCGKQTRGEQDDGRRQWVTVGEQGENKG